MERADFDARQQLLETPLLRELSRQWPSVEFTVDVAAATERPGAPISLSWDDGPARDTVARALHPQWSADGNTHDLDAAVVAGAYPVTLHRAYSHRAWSAALLMLHDTGSLAAATAAGRAGFFDVVGKWLGSRALPDDLEHSLRVRSELLAEILETSSGSHDSHDWAHWLMADGDRVLTRVLPAALEQTTPVGETANSFRDDRESHISDITRGWGRRSWSAAVRRAGWRMRLLAANTTSA